MHTSEKKGVHFAIGLSHFVFREPLFVMYQATSRKYQGVFKVKSRVKTWQVRGIWSQQLEQKQVPKRGTEPGTKFDPMLIPVPIRWGTYFPLYSRTIKHSLICRTTWYNNWKCAKISNNKLRKNLWFYCNFNLRFSEVM